MASNMAVDREGNGVSTAENGALNGALNGPAASSSVKTGRYNAFAKFSLKGKIALATGAARGIGFAMARAMCASGLDGIIIMDVLNEHGDAATAALYQEFQVPAVFYKVDVRDETAVHEAVNGAVSHFGRIDVLLCAAGIVDTIRAEEYPVDKFRRVMDINVTGCFLTAQAVGRHMISSKHPGSIIMIASMSGSVVNWPRIHPSDLVDTDSARTANASKAAVMHLAKSLAAEWAGFGIRVNTISPGYVSTALVASNEFDQLKKIWREKTPLGRMGEVDEMTGAVQFLASEASSFVTGADFKLDGGYTAL